MQNDADQTPGQARVPAGFAENAARLVEAARANERAVRDLEEATELLSEGMLELARCEGLAQALGDLSDQIAEAADAADAMRDAADLAADATQVLEAIDALDRHVARAEEAAGALSGRVEALAERLEAALDHVEKVDPVATLDRVAALEAKVDRILQLLEPPAADEA